MSITHFKVFRDIAQSNSISRAAELNQISQSAVSQTLKTLERQLGVDLVDRRSRPLRLTAAGEIYRDASREIVRRYEEMQARMDALRKELAGTVRVASIYSIGLYEMQQLREEFLSAHPRADIRLDYMRPDKIYEAILSDTADLGLVSYPTAIKGLRTIDWRREQMVLVCHPDHRLAKLASVPPAQLAGVAFISFDPGLSIRRALDRFFREQGVQREIAFEFDNIEMIKEALRHNQGVSVLPERTVREDVAAGRLVTRPIEPRRPAPQGAEDPLVRPVGIVLDRTKKLSQIAEEFLQFLAERPQA